MSLLDIRDLVVEYPGRRRRPIRVLDGVSLDVRPGETVGLVGESGSGKTTLGRAVLGSAPVAAGTITFDGEDITHAPRGRRRALAADLQAVFQDPYSSLNPAMTIGSTLAEPLQAGGASAVDARQRIAELLSLVDLPADATHRYPREFSGGQRQRVAIARALALRPRLVVCDEPVSALDVTTQARVLELFLEVQARTGVSFLFISHDLAVVRFLSHRVAVVRSGQIVEFGDGDQVTSDPAHAYTRELLLSAPVADPMRQAERRAILHASRRQESTP